MTVSGKTVTISKDGRVATGTIDENGHINWNAGTNPTKGDWAYSKQGDETIITDGTVNLHIGDYVQYDPLAGVTNALAKTYKSTSDNNGYQDQEFKLSRLATTTGAGWRVLGLKEDTKQIMLVSDTVVGPGDTSESFYLKGRTGYKNGISELNNICDLYGHGTHATGGRSITVDDVNKLTGYNPDTEKYGEGNVCEYENQVTYYWDGTDNPYYTWGSNNSGNLGDSHSDGFWWFNNSTKEWVKSSKAAATTTNKSEITTLTSTYYYYSGSSKISTDSNEYKVIFKKNSQDEDGERRSSGGSNLNYWLGSTCVITYSNITVFGLRGVHGGRVYYQDLAHSDCFEGYGRLGVLPVVFLESDVNLKQGAISGEWQFVQ